MSKNNIHVKFDTNKIKYYYGIPNCHSQYSTGKGTPYSLYEHAIKYGLNYLFITDDNSFLESTTTFKDKAFTKWQATNYAARRIRKDKDNFLPIVGFECKTTSFGDFTIINPSNFFTGTLKDMRVLALWMLNNDNAFISINNPRKNIRELGYNAVLNKLITCIDVFNGSSSSPYTNHEKYFYFLLDQGWQLGAINGQENHMINFDLSESLTAYIGNDLSKASLVEAFRAHRTYSTESRFLKLYFTINNTFMGDVININYDKLKIFIFTEDIHYKIKEIQILSTGGHIIKKIEDIDLNSIKYIYEHYRLPNENWFVIKVLQENNKIAISSPIFINEKNKSC